MLMAKSQAIFRKLQRSEMFIASDYYSHPPSSVGATCGTCRSYGAWGKLGYTFAINMPLLWSLETQINFFFFPRIIQCKN